MDDSSAANCSSCVSEEVGERDSLESIEVKLDLESRNTDGSGYTSKILALEHQPAYSV
jgi:hypothetical protein